MKSPEQIAHEIYDAELEPAEVDRRIRAFLASPGEMEERASLIRWFTTRYPTAKDRLAYARRKYREMMRR